MQLMFLDLLRMGVLQLLYDFSNWPLSLAAWLAVLLGAFLQLFLLKKGKAWIYISILVLTVLVSEVLCNVITGWDQFLPLLLYAIVVYLILGAGMGSLFHFLKRKP